MKCNGIISRRRSQDTEHDVRECSSGEEFDDYGFSINISGEDIYPQ
jgi:hypothetical protein